MFAKLESGFFVHLAEFLFQLAVEYMSDRA